ncbi:MAG: hypothetical protein K8S87_09370, partial [Planctomycetes bacterium]|nr:hypothetical protein [Planctomycetota bacterium]
QSDIYSLGAILYEILSFKQAFPGSDSSKVIQKVKRHKFLPPSIAAPMQNIPRELEHVVLNAMAYKPEERYLTVNQLKEEIEAYIDGRVLSSVDYSMIQLFIKWFLRNMTALSIAVVFGLSFLIMAIIWVNDMSSQRNQAIEQTNILHQDKEALQNDIKKLNESNLVSRMETASQTNIFHIQEALINNNLAKLKELRKIATSKYAKLIDYYIDKQENPYIEKTSKRFFGQILVCKATDDDIALITSNNTLYIFENLNDEPVKTIRFHNSPSSISISDDGMIILATFKNGAYQVLDSFGTKIYENTIEDFEISHSAVSPLGNLISVSNSTGNVLIIKWRENITKLLDNLEGNISSNLKFINQTTLCLSFVNTNFVIISWDKELNSIDNKTLTADSLYRKIYSGGSDIFLVDAFNTISRMRTSNLFELNSLSDFFSSNNKTTINNEIYCIDSSNNFIWEMKQNILQCRDLSTGNFLKSFKYIGNVFPRLLKIIEFKNEIFIFTTDGLLYKLSKNHYSDIPLYVNNSLNLLKIWKYKNNLFALSANGIYKSENNTFALIKSSPEYYNKIVSFNYNKIGYLFIALESNEIAIYNMFDKSYRILLDIEISNTISINSIKSSLDNNIVYFTILTKDSVLHCFEINQLIEYRKLWSKKVRFANSKSITLIPKENMVFIIEDINHITTYNILSGKKLNDISIDYPIDGIHSSQNGQTLFITCPENIIRYTKMTNMKDYLTLLSNHFTPVYKISTDDKNSWITTFNSNEVKIRKYSSRNKILSFASSINAETVFFDEDNNFIYYLNHNTRTIDYLSLKEINRIFQ